MLCAGEENNQTNRGESDVQNRGIIPKFVVKLHFSPLYLWRNGQFYFGDKNLPRDKFLQEQIKKDDKGCILALCIVVFAFQPDARCTLPLRWAVTRV